MLVRTAQARGLASCWLTPSASLRRPRPSNRDPVIYAFSSVVAEGRYTLRAAAIDAMGLQGSVERVFSARLAGTTAMRLSDLMLAPVPASPAAPLSPIVDRAIGDALVAYIEFQAPAAARPAVRVIIARGPSDPPLVTTAASVSSRADGWAEARATIPLGELPRRPRPRRTRRRRRASRRHVTTVHDPGALIRARLQRQPVFHSWALPTEAYGEGGSDRIPACPP